MWAKGGYGAKWHILKGEIRINIFNDYGYNNGWESASAACGTLIRAPYGHKGSVGKIKLREHMDIMQANVCAYCRKSLKGEQIV